MTDDTPENTDNFEQEIGGLVTSLAKRFDDELYALSETELFNRWHFTWDDRGDVIWNLYQFSDSLEFHKSRCRGWEEHHNGYTCVVERVRDKYLMPRLREFRDMLSHKLNADLVAENTRLTNHIGTLGAMLEPNDQCRTYKSVEDLMKDLNDD